MRMLKVSGDPKTCQELSEQGPLLPKSAFTPESPPELRPKLGKADFGNTFPGPHHLNARYVTAFVSNRSQMRLNGTRLHTTSTVVAADVSLLCSLHLL